MRNENVSNDRAAGALVGLAVGDALGAGYEFTHPSPDEAIEMKGGGSFGWERGEWTDDTQMAICIAEVTSQGLLDVEEIGDRFLEWFHSRPKDVGAMTAAVLGRASTGAELSDAARRYHSDHPDSSAGNGSLMRTAPVALAFLGDDDAIAEAGRSVSAITHADRLCQEACVLWCIAIDRAIRHERLDGVWDGLDLLPGPAKDRWAQRLREAESQPAKVFTPNGFVVTALQAAHAAITATTDHDSAFPCCQLQLGLRTAVRIGHDTDTVAAIAGQVLGARWGATAVPFDWRRQLHGWPSGYVHRDLMRLAVLTARGGQPDPAGWPSASRLMAHYRRTNPHPPVAEPLPDDPGVIVGNVAGIDRAVHGHGADVVISLCRIGAEDVPDHLEHREVLLIDEIGSNENLDFVLADTVRALLTYRYEGKRVFLHCAGGTSRTPTVAALYLAARNGTPGPEALQRVKQVIAHSPHNTDFAQAVDRAAGKPLGCVEGRG